MSRRNSDGSWTVPQNQVDEFFNSRIDYNSLVKDCIKTPTKALNKQATFGRYAAAETELELDVEVSASGIVRFLNTRIF